MKLLCHRGLWQIKSEQNSLAALSRAIESGFGLETDIRDHNGNLVISHDPPIGEGVISLERLLEAYCNSDHKILLALNVKADGLCTNLDEMLRTFDVGNYFVFDMSLPDTLPYLTRGMPIAVRLSEYENGKSLLEKASTVWLDAFQSEWYSIEEVLALLDAGKRVCVVSPELHRRPHQELWRELTKIPANLMRNCYLCTDLFEQAKEVFDVEKD